ncbi:MAG: CHAT domain-containing protein [Janthinobacterium lividum]
MRRGPGTPPTTRAVGAALTAALLLSACATSRVPERPDSFSLGRTTAGEPCVATRDWHDAGLTDAFSRAYSMTCQSVSASRPVGAIRIVPATADSLAPIEAMLSCGPARAATVAGRAARARRCRDGSLDEEVVRLDVPFGRTLLVADAPPALVAELEEALAILAGSKRPSADAGRTVAASVDASTLAPAPAGASLPAVAAKAAAGDPAKPAATGAAAPVEVATQVVAAADAGAFDPADALAQGVTLNHKGQNVEASRVLNDALSRLPAATPPTVRVELLLEAGLADSNIRFVDTARDHFAQADAAMAAEPGAQTAFLQRKRDAYLALDALNRHAFREALTLLDRIARAPVAADQPLRDPATLRLLNRPRVRPGDLSGSIAVPDTADLTQLVLDAQANWARSVALLTLGDEAGAMTAIEAAANAYRPLQTERIDRAQVLWLGARIERQRARLLARHGQSGAALAGFDRAIDDLRRGALATAGTGNEPAIAEAELERAAFYAHTGAPHAAVRAQFASVVDSLIDSHAGSLGAATGIEDYLDLLADEAATGPLPDTFERFFRAVQVTGEPAVARQLSQLQTVVSADPEIGAMVRDRAELERDITRLRYEIAGGAAPGQPTVAELERARGAAEARLLAVDARLASSPRFRSVDEQPATLAELRAALKPGEAYFKVVETGRRIYGLYVSADRTQAYRIAPDAQARAAIDQLAADVRASIDGQLDQGKLVPFDDAKAYALFRVLGGPAADALAGTRALVVDPAGPLERLPIGVLVTRYARDEVRPAPFDFSRTAFLAGTATISTALSPRSFLVARALPASQARQPLLGLGEHVPFKGAAGTDPARTVRIGYGCTITYGALAALGRSFQPISGHELTVVADALGDPQAPRIVDAAFSDTAIEARGDLADYQVLHFATHGLEEGQWGCAQSPPALVTSWGGEGSDGLLSFSEIARLRLDANLVVLSACDTAGGVRNEALARLSGQEEAGATLDGLVRAFLAANARAVMATYWQVSAERDGEQFVGAFYAGARAKPIGAALRDAQRGLMTQPAYSHPFYWAPYFVVGDTSKSMLSARPAQIARR